MVLLVVDAVGEDNVEVVEDSVVEPVGVQQEADDVDSMTSFSSEHFTIEFRIPEEVPGRH